ncbi:ABC transporter substrate-binding protein [Thermorudis peleae]|uniref:ABC transporter substrate-binding protein n=1 Tax=Thermorudis peleae TaxID=1382356 RepID=UPI00068E6824|nr:peptide ABC transporter substrate-binding protein [Thermorudis peleae]
MRQQKQHRHVWIGIVLTLLLLVPGCSWGKRAGSTATPTPATSQAVQQAAPAAVTVSPPATGQTMPAVASRTLVEGGLDEPRTLNPLFVADPLSEELSHLVFDGLVSVDPQTGEPTPALAASWDVSDDRQTYTFHLRPGVQWHDGQPLTAQDVVFTYQRMMDENVRSPRYSRLAGHVKSVTAIDQQTVAITLYAPDAAFLTTIATLGIVPEHLLGSIQPAQLITDPFGISSAVGTGPFTLSQWVRGETIVFTRNPNYFRGAPQVEQYIYRIFPSLDDLVAALRNGQVQWATVSASLATNVPDIPGVTKKTLPGFGLTVVAFQLDSSKFTLFQDARVRKALFLALDRAAMVKEIYGGAARVAQGTIPPASWAASAVNNVPGPNRTEAGQLLDQAGWTVGSDGFRQHNGKRLQFTLLATGADPGERALAIWLANQWRTLGVDVTIDFQPWSEVRKRLTETRDFQAALLTINWGIDPDQSDVWSSNAFYSGLNLMHYASAAVDKALADGLATDDRSKRQAAYQQLQQTLLNDLPVLPLAFPDRVVLWSTHLQAPSLTPLALRLRLGVEQWHMTAS